MGPLPESTIRTVASAMAVTLCVAPDDKLDIGLFMELPPPLGLVRVHIEPGQLVDLHDGLHALLDLDADGAAALLAQVRNGGQQHNNKG